MKTSFSEKQGNEKHKIMQKLTPESNKREHSVCSWRTS